MLYNIVLVSAIHQCESAIGMAPPSSTSLRPPTSSHPSRLSQGTRSELLPSYSTFPLALYFAYDNVSVSMLRSLFILLLPLLCPQVCSLCLCLHKPRPFYTE